MKKLLLICLFILVGGIAIADQNSSARNVVRTEMTATTNTTYTTPIEGSFSIYSDTLVYINTVGTTPNAGYEGLAGGVFRSYWPITWPKGSIIKISADSGTAKLTIYSHDE